MDTRYCVAYFYQIYYLFIVLQFMQKKLKEQTAFSVKVRM
jgi:hypothetical protein